MSGFDAALDHVFRWEGGYVNDPRDPGGETKYGISKRAYPDMDIAALTTQQAAAIYRRDYWQRAGCDDLPPAQAAALFDAAVNAGAARARRWYEERPEWRDQILARIAHYVDIAYRRPDMRVFLLGWLRRVVDLVRLCRSLESSA